jgi:nitroreductase
MNKMMDIIEALEWRYAVKKFDPSKKVSEQQMDRILKGLQLTPTSMGLQLMRFIVITDEKIKEEITPIAFNQSQVKDCSHLVVMCRKESVSKNDIDSFVNQTAKTREVDVKSETMLNFEKMLSGSINLPEAQQKAWMENQVYIALGNLMTLCAAENVDTCPMEGFDRQKLDTYLNLAEDGLNAVVMCPIGYRSEQDKYGTVKKVRRPLTSLIEKR